MGNRRNAVLGVAGTIGGIVLTIFLTQTVFASWIEKMTWFAENGFLGIVLFLVLYILLAIFLAPASFHKFICGVLFGFWIGWVLAFIGACLGAIVPFWLSRKYMQEWFNKKLKSKPTIKALKQAVGEDGFKCVLLTRMSLVIPYPVLNYGFGLTDVKWKDYIYGNVGMIIPGVLYAWWGSQASELSAAVDGGRDWTYWLAITLSIILTVWIIYYLRKITLKHITLNSPQ